MLLGDLEARIRALEVTLRKQIDLLQKQADQLGAVQQNQTLQSGPGLGAGGTGSVVYHAFNSGTEIAAATSSTQMTSSTVTIQSSDNTGALTSGGSVTVWNKSTTGTVAAGASLLYCVDAQGQPIVFWEQC